MKLLYVCSSQFSGSTLISFLLNNHSAIATVGHTMGWSYSDEEDFRCSCGSRISDCRLFTRVRKTFTENGIPFDPRRFGTAFELSANSRVNQLLTGRLPLLRSSLLELTRDRLVQQLKKFRSLLERQQTANHLLMQTVLGHMAASVFLDNSHSPYRLRILQRNGNFDVYPLHLIRDPRGVSLSLMTNSGLNVKEAIRNWIHHQMNIFRISNEGRSSLVVSYESLCRDTDSELSRIHEFAGVEQQQFNGNFKDEEHHILGNRMRLTSGVIRLDERWKQDLSAAELQVIEKKLRRFQSAQRSHPLSSIIDAYLVSN